MMTREEVESMADQLKKIREENGTELRALEDRIAKLEGALEHLRKSFATRLTQLGG